MLEKLKKSLAQLSGSDQNLAELQAKVHALEDERAGLLEHYKLLTGNLAAAIVIRDKSQKISYCSPYTEVLTGYPVSEIYSAHEDFFLGTVHEEDKERYTRALKVTAIGEPFQFRYRFFHKSGIEMWAETRTVPVNGPDGALLFTLSVTLDVTGTVRYQRQVEEKNRELRDFTYMVTHDLKGPILTIKGMLNLIKEDHPNNLDHELCDALSHIDKAALRLEQLVGSVLEYSKITNTEIKTKPISLSKLLAEIKDEMHRQLENCCGTLQIPSELPLVIGDEIKLYQVFANLIGNSIKYRDPNRKLMIEVGVAAHSSARYVNISIKDNGLGIPSDKLEAIFRPFQRAHIKNIEGSGIGLACAKRLVEKFGGEITVQSQEGLGSTFEVTLRRA